MNSVMRSRISKKPFRLFFPLVVLVIVSLACSSLGPGATSTPLPTNTPIPTNTALPTNTPKPTPNRTATKLSQNRATQAAETQVAESIIGGIGSKLEEVGEFLENGSLLYTSTEPIELVSSQHGKWTYDLLDATGSDFAMHANITWSMKDNIGLANCAFLYRMGKDLSNNDWYAVVIQRISGFSFDWFELDGPTYAYSDFFPNKIFRDENGSTNEMLLTMHGNTHTVYINGQQNGVWYNAKASSGGFGLAAFQDTGTTTCVFDDLWIWGWE